MNQDGPIIPEPMSDDFVRLMRDSLWQLEPRWKQRMRPVFDWLRPRVVYRLYSIAYNARCITRRALGLHVHGPECFDCWGMTCRRSG